MRICTLDFETRDPYIKLKLGAGWAYAYNVKDSPFKILGAAVGTYDGIVKYITDWDELKEILQQHDTILAHNATYELGILHCIYKGTDITWINELKVLDTKLLYKLYDNTLMSYTLDALAKRYVKEPKGHQILIDAIWDNGLYPWLKKEITEKNRAEKKGEEYIRTKPEDKKILKFAYENMDLLQEKDFDSMSKYAISDIDLTYKLYKFVIDKLDIKLVKKFSYLTHICVQYRLKGVRIDLTKAAEIYDKLTPLIVEKCKEAYLIAGYEFNINSPKEMPTVFDKLKIKYPRTKAGNPSITTPWLEKQSHPICKIIVDARKYKKIQGDFIKKIMNMQEYTCPSAYPNGSFGMIYPEINILEAKTGRFSSTCPNIQQIPSRDKVLAPLCRSIFVPFEGETWYSLDFSNQEGRLVVHYANLLGCEGANELALEFQKDPNLDMHQRGADLAGISRKEAKSIVLGIMYGMGIGKLALSLNLSEQQAIILKEKYDMMLPFLTQLNTCCRKLLKERGYLKTISGRMSRLDPPVFIEGSQKTFEYKALNKLIQGSAADMSIEAMIAAYKAGLPVLFPVHDEFNLSGTREQAEKMQEIMENCIEMSVPSIAEIGEGTSWADAK
jgi:DNA polymerase I-like protein with 3'-5' exonuclease and polymerase domains